MSKKHFIALAQTIIDHNAKNNSVFGPNAIRMNFSPEAIDSLANFCRAQNPQFDRARWLGYIAGENGPSGGTIKGSK